MKISLSFLRKIIKKEISKALLVQSILEGDPIYEKLIKINRSSSNFQALLSELFPKYFERYDHKNMEDILTILFDDVKLTQNEIEDILIDSGTIANYVEKHYNDIDFDSETKNLVFRSKYLIEYFQNSDTIGSTVYRGIKVPEETNSKDYINKSIEKNMSFSTSESKALLFSKKRLRYGQKSVLISTRVTKTNLFADLSQLYNEGEVLLKLKPNEFIIKKETIPEWGE